MNPYETPGLLDQYLLFHYGSDDEVLPYSSGPRNALGFHRRCIDILLAETSPRPMRALDLGCAVGRSAFELARYCSRVVGIDGSRSFIQAALTLKNKRSLAYAFYEEGGIAQTYHACIDEDIDTARVEFCVDDAEVLSQVSETFDVILLANLIDRLQNPRKCLANLARLSHTGTYILIASPYTWRTEYTEQKNWLGGYIDKGRTVRTLESIKTYLNENFELKKIVDIPFLIKEHARKYQWSVAEGTLWKYRWDYAGEV